MQDPQSQLVHSDRHRIPVNLTLLFSLGVAAFGVYTYLQSGDGLLLIVAGLGVGAYSWFTNPRQYDIYEDSLVVVYGAPRKRVIPFSNISHLEMRTLATPDRLRAWLTSGRRVVLMARNPEDFHDHLQKALDDFHRAHPELAPTEDIPESQDSSEERERPS
jgi:hypothetical protein